MSSLREMANKHKKDAKSNDSVIRKRFGSFTGQVGTTKKGKNPGSIYHNIGVEGHWHLKLSLAFMATLEELGVEWPDDAREAAHYVGGVLDDAEQIAALKKAYEKEKEKEKKKKKETETETEDGPGPLAKYANR